MSLRDLNMLTDSEGSNHLDYQDHGKSKCKHLSSLLSFMYMMLS